MEPNAMKTSFLRIRSPVLLGLLSSLILAPDTRARVFVATNSTWRYFKGASEASTPPDARPAPGGLRAHADGW
jgi:hypothetical protein